MARPQIQYNGSSGSDTAASGAGPATAVTGSNAYSGDGAGGGTQTVINLSGDTPDLSGVTADTDAIYLATATGERHLFQIIAVDDGANTVTVEIAPDTSIDTGSEVSWAIGGKRKTLENDTSQPDWDDARHGWHFVLEGDGTVYTITSEIQMPTGTGDHTYGPVVFRSSDPDTVQPVIDRTGSFNSFYNNGGRVEFRGLKFTRSSGSSSHSAIGAGAGSDYTGVFKCEVDGTGMDHCIDMGSYTFVIDECNFHSCDRNTTSHGITDQDGTGNTLIIRRTRVHDNDGYGINLGSLGSYVNVFIENTVIYDNTDSGIYINAFSIASYVEFRRLTLHANDGDGIEIADTTGDDRTSIIFEELALVDNGGYGVNIPTDQLNLVIRNRNNLYYNNTSGARNNLPEGDDELTSDPQFVSETDGSEDFEPDTGSPLIDAGISFAGTA